MDGQLVRLSDLPSKGYGYPNDIEIYIKPLSIKEQIDMERYGISDAEYFKMVLDGVTIRGNFDKNKLLHSDVQFMDIVRRLYSFDINKEITIKGCRCNYRDCEHEFDYKFKIADLEFTDFNEDIFNKHFIFQEGSDDELKVVVYPITTAEYMSMSREFKNHKDKKTALSAMYTEYLCTCIREVIGREFKDKKDRDSYLKDYLGGLYLGKDKKLVKQIVDETLIKIKPFTVVCEECDRETEVEVTPTSNFQQ